MNEHEATELYRKYRPQTFKEMVGQQAAVTKLVSMCRNNRIPHVLLFTGPSGCGKTTAARILKTRLKCSDYDFHELDAGQDRGIDMMRTISQQMHLKPMTGKSRIYLLDECFPAGTLIQLADQSQKPIEQVRPGDVILGLHGPAPVKQTFQNKVYNAHLRKIWLSNGQSLVTTKHHKFLTGSGWITADSLFNHCVPQRLPSFTNQAFVTDDWQANDNEDFNSIRQMLRLVQEHQVALHRVVGVEPYVAENHTEFFYNVTPASAAIAETRYFYDLEIKGHPSYFADGICAHNCHAITPQAQDALLKSLEDTPAHVYFFLCTTDPGKLKKTLRTRAVEIAFKPLSFQEAKSLISKIAGQESRTLDDNVVGQIVGAAEGSARMALQLLHSILDISDSEAQSAAITQTIEGSDESLKLARLLMHKASKYQDVAAVLETLNEDPEEVRWRVLNYAKSCLLRGSNPRAYRVICAFRFNFYESKAAGLAAACYEVFQ